MRLYGSEENVRWRGFEHRAGDIVISTRSKCGTTWMQMMCALLIFQTPHLPVPLAELSPWLDWSVEPIESVRGRLAAQEHRRIIKTHTPLDGLPLDPRVTYIVVGRHPLDVAVSLYHHAHNLDRERMAELSGKASSPAPSEPLVDWLRDWISADVAIDDQLDTLIGLLHHVDDAWTRLDQPNVVLVHYQDLADDTELQMRLLAQRLNITVPEDRWPILIQAASFGAMRRGAEWVAPDRLGVLKDARSFFRAGRSGDGRALLDDEDLDRYERRARELAHQDVITWLHHDLVTLV